MGDNPRRKLVIVGDGGSGSYRLEQGNLAHSDLTAPGKTTLLTAFRTGMFHDVSVCPNDIRIGSVSETI